MEEKINVANPTKENIDYAFKNLVFYINASLQLDIYNEQKESFDDNCYKLDILRWFRDKFVSVEDKNHYYEVAPIIVSGIDSIPEKDTIYQYIYENIVTYCVRAIENEEFDKAYTRYKNSVLSLEQQFTKPVLKNRLIKTLKLKTNK